MRNDSADAVDPQFDGPHLDTEKLLVDADALGAIDASWDDEAAPTGVIQPKHFPPAPSAVEGDWGPASRPPALPRDDENPHWDDEGETVALNFDRLAPWVADESVESLSDQVSGDAKWEIAETDKLEPYKAGPLAVFALENRSRPRVSESGKYQVHAAPQALPPRRSPQRIPPLPSPRSASGVREILRGPDSTPSHSSVHAEPSPRMAAGMSSRPRRPTPAPAPRTPRPPSVRSVPPPPPSAVSTRNLRPLTPTLRPPAPPSREPRPVLMMTPPVRATPPAPHAPRVPTRPPRSVVPAARSGGYAVPPPIPSQGFGQAPRPVAAPRTSLATGPFAPMPRPMLRPVQPTAAELAELAELEAALRPKRAPAWLWLAVIAAAVFTVVLVIRLALLPSLTQSVASSLPAQVAPPDTAFAITTRPAGAQVFVDGKSTGLITPARVGDLAPGLHAIDLKLPGHFDTSLPAALETGKTLQLEDVELRPLAVVAVEPAAETTATPQLPSARVSRRAARRERQRAVASVSAIATAEEPAAAAADEPAPLAPDTADVTGEGVLKVNSRPWARIFIGDQFRGNTPQRALSLPVGKHVVRLVNEPMKMSKTFTVEIRAGETATRIETLNEDGAAGTSESDEPAL